MILALTGATGFVGQAVLDEAATRGLAVRALARREQAQREGVTWVRGDLADPAALAQLVQGCDAVMHVAGVVNAGNRAGFALGNIDGTKAVLAAGEDAGVRRLVHVSSLATREPGLSDYCWSKAGAEQAVLGSALDWTIVRPPAVYGPRDSELRDVFRTAKWGLVPLPPRGRASIIHVRDLARLLLTLCAPLPETSGQIYEPDDGRLGGWGHGEFAAAIGAALGRRVWAPHLPGALLLAAGHADRLLRGPGAKLTPDRARYMAHPDWVSAPDRIVPGALWSPQIAAADGLAETAAWYRAQGWL